METSLLNLEDPPRKSLRMRCPRIVRDMDKVRNINRRLTREIRDLDCFNHVDEVNEELEKALGKPGSRKVMVTSEG